jgi:hypothetical protein
MADWPKLRAGIERLERRPGYRGRWDWYAEGYPCGRPADECREHSRARADQRPPAGAWRTWLMLMGRGAGKTRVAAEWVRRKVESGAARRLALVDATTADVRDTMVDGESGILANVPGPGCRPGAAAGDGLRRLPRRGPVRGGGGRGDPEPGPRAAPPRVGVDGPARPGQIRPDRDQPGRLCGVRAGLGSTPRPLVRRDRIRRCEDASREMATSAGGRRGTLW